MANPNVTELNVGRRCKWDSSEMMWLAQCLPRCQGITSLIMGGVKCEWCVECVRENEENKKKKMQYTTAHTSHHHTSHITSHTSKWCTDVDGEDSEEALKALMQAALSHRSLTWLHIPEDEDEDEDEDMKFSGLDSVMKHRIHNFTAIKQTLTLCMGLHPRLGADSDARMLNQDVMETIMKHLQLLKRQMR